MCKFSPGDERRGKLPFGVSALYEWLEAELQEKTGLVSYFGFLLDVKTDTASFNRVGCAVGVFLAVLTRRLGALVPVSLFPVR